VVRLKTYRAELHIHTVLSPCAEIEMIPPLIVQQAVSQGINLIAITDHNATANIASVQKAAQGSGLVVLPGMELQTKEEVHVLCLFDTLEQAEELQETVNRTLPDIDNQPDHFGEQFVVDDTGGFIRRESRLLLTSANITLNQVWQLVSELDGLLIPAHIDRRTFGLIGTLGFVPTDIKLEALEISRLLKPEDAARRFPQVAGYPLIQSGDAHMLSEFLGVNEFRIAQPIINELRKAFKQEEDRSHKILSQ
jgi:3',5'-nucleoside bisphosphate phosphatase